MDQSINQTKTSTTYSNQDYIDNSALQIRLLTKDLLIDIKNFLEGKELSYAQEGNTWIQTATETGIELCNSEGVQGIMSNMKLLLNPQVVQGNFTEDMYFQYIGRVREDLTDAVIINRINWSIKEQHTDLIIDWIMNCVKPFISRTLGNKERESYSKSLTSNENSNQNSADLRKKGLLW